MSPILVVGGVAAVAVLLLFAVVFSRLIRTRHATPVDPEWLASFSPARYRPMHRLLAEGDVVFLAGQAGYTRSKERRFRRERRRIFGAYLRNLGRDFERLHRAARVLMLSAPEDRPEFAAALLRLRLDFGRAMLAARFRLLLNAIDGSAVDVRGLVGALESLNAHVHTLAVAPSAG